jgi:serine/threonine-protein kinase
LARQGLSSDVLQQLVSGSAQSLLPSRATDRMPEEPYRQLWYAAAVQILENLSIEPIEARPQVTQILSADVPANGARLFPIRLPVGHSLVLGVNGTPLLQMSVYGADGRALAPRGPLRVVNLGVQQGSPVQLLITNEGVAASRISLSLRADPPAPAAQETPSPGEAGSPTKEAAPPEAPTDTTTPPDDGAVAPSTSPTRPSTPSPGVAPPSPPTTPPTAPPPVPAPTGGVANPTP